MSNPNNSVQFDPLDHNTKWCDIPVSQVFQFDHQPVNVIQVGKNRSAGVGAGQTANGQYNNLYQLTRRLQNKQLGGWQKWMNWVQKIQPDYKFLTILQQNAQTCIFANVDDPWMFTQYIYKGIGKYYDPNLQEAVESKYVVIQPALYDWDTLSPLNVQASQRESKQGGTWKDKGQQQYFHVISNDGHYKPQFGYKYIKRYTTGADGAYIYKACVDVECVKWGQHGNVPPHVIDMQAPSKYMQSATKLTLKTLQKPVLGVPIYHDSGGVFRRDGDHLYVDGIYISQFEPTVVDTQTNNVLHLARQSIAITESQQQLYRPVTMLDPQKGVKQYTTLRLVSTQRQSGQLLVNGCKYYKIISKIDSASAVCGCSLESDFNQQQKNKAVCNSSCAGKNTSCPFYTKAFNLNSPQVIVARFQSYQRRYVDNDFQLKKQETQLKNLATLCMGTGTMGGALTGIGITNSVTSGAVTNYKDTSGYTGQITYETVYQMQQTPLNGIVVNVPPNAQNYRGATVQRGTGQSAFDLPAIADRIIYQNDTSPINYTRWMSNIMPCYDKKFCSTTIGESQSQKIHFPCNCGVDYKDYGNHNQIITKNSGFCPYYKLADKKNMGCPYNSINKHAMDFAMHNKFMNQNLFQSVAIPIANRFNSGQGEYQTNQISAKQDKDSGIITVYYKDEFTNADDITIRNFPNDDVAVVQLSKMYGIQQQVLRKYHKDKLWQLCKVKTTKGKVRCFAKYWPYVIDQYSDGSNNASRLKKDGKDVQWCFEVDYGPIPPKDPLFVDNEQKFIGGYHPQYLQYPATPDQILYKKQQQYDTYDVIQTKADASEYGQASRGTKQVQYGYFVMQTGNWVLDGRAIGTVGTNGTVTFPTHDELVGAKNQRASSPAQSFMGGIAIHNIWQNTLIDPQAQKPIMKQIKNCIIFANDTQESIQALEDDPPTIQSQTSDDQIEVPPCVSYPEYLPRHRKGCFCSNCKTVLALRFYQFADGEVNKCPWCGTKLTIQSPLQYFPRTKAMGRVSVWGLPGTVIKTDNYFWKSQAKVNNALIDQMTFKLGIPNTHGGGYKQTDSNAESQKIDRVGYSVSSKTFTPQRGKYAMGISQEAIGKKVANATELDNLVMTNPNQPKKVLSYSTEIDNRIINPFTEDFKGLKMVTTDYMYQIRNRLQPTLAYVVGKKPNQDNFSSQPIDSFYAAYDIGKNPAKPQQYQQYHVKFDDRKYLSDYKKWVKRRSVVNNVVLAYAGPAGAQAQAFVQFPVGDQEQCYWGKKYYPPDPHWWYDRQLIGGIATSLTGNQCHFDLPQKRYPGYRWNAYKNIQKNLYSVVFMSMHGYVPLDKIVVAAYLIQPGNQISCDEDAVGQFQLIGSNMTRVAYNHYHSFYKSTLHQKGAEGATWDSVDCDSIYPYGNCHVHKDSGNFKDGDRYAVILDYDGDVCSSSDKHYVDKYGDLFFIDEKSGIPIYKRKYFQKYKNKFLTKTQDVHLNPWHQQNLPYYSMLKKVNMDSVLSSLHHSVDSHIGDNKQGDGYGVTETDCIKWNGFGTDIIQTKTQNQIWKQFTTQEFQKYQQLYRAQIQYTIDFGEGNVQTKQFTQYYSKFNDFINEQMQPIPGYFPTDGVNTSGLLNIQQNKTQVDTKDIQGQYGDFIVTQASNESNDRVQINGESQEYVQSGQSDKVINITENFKNLYYARKKVIYTAETSQKTVSDFYKLDAAVWEGIGSQPTWVASYNNRVYATDGYYLNTNQNLPQLDDDRLIATVQYEKIQCDKHRIFYSLQTNRSYQFGSNDEITITKTENNKNQTEKVTIIDSDSSSTVSVADIVSKLNDKGVPAVLLNDNIVIDGDDQTSYVIDVGGQIKFKGTTASACNRLVSYTNYYGEYHPYNLVDFNTAGGNSTGWITISDNDQVQTCIIDLYQMPRLKSARDYRVQSGYTDYTNAYCTNQDCRLNFKHDGKLTVGAAAHNQGLSFNKGTSSCPWCAHELSGGSVVQSDGIETYVYDQLFEYDQIIKTIQLKMTNGSGGSDIVKSNKVNAMSLSVSDDLQKWECILTALPETDNNYTVDSKYLDQSSGSTYSQYNGSSKQTFEVGKNKLIRGRYLKVSIQPSVYYYNYSYNISSYNSGCVVLGGTNSESQLKDVNLTEIEDIPNGYLKGSACKIYFLDSDNKIGVLELIVKDNVGKNIYVDGSIVGLFVDSSNTLVRMQLQGKLYKTCLMQLSVVGCSYNSSKLIITPKQTIETRSYSTQADLGYLPIRFDKVSVVINDCYEIILQQIEGYSDVNDDEKGLKYWGQVVTQTFTVPKMDFEGEYILDKNGKIQYENKTISYYKITKGRFYFNVAHKKIMLPKRFYTTKYINQVPFGEEGADTQKIKTNYKKSGEYYVLKMDQLTDNLSKWGVSKPYKITSLNTVIWSGQQGGVKLKITAAEIDGVDKGNIFNGRGPAFQIQRGSINFIETEKYKNGGTQDVANGVSTPLPDPNGVYNSYAAINRNTSKYTIPWVVYNNQLITKKDGSISQLSGQFYITSNATMFTSYSAETFKSDIAGTNMQRAVGKCQGQIILKGKPNTVITGQLKVSAAAVTKRKFNDNVYAVQLTGGLDYGGMMISPKIKLPQGGDYRAALAYNLPYMLVYMKQRSPFSSEIPFQVQGAVVTETATKAK